jgi:hypothetical protein
VCVDRAQWYCEMYICNTMRAAIRIDHLDTPGKFPQI